jgi:PEP-CTERM motif
MKYWLCALLMCASFAFAGPLTVTQTTDGAVLAAALGGGGGLTINSAAVLNGAATQFATYTGFNSSPVMIGDGVVMSSGDVTQVTAAFHSTADTPSTDTGQSGTAEFDAYGPGHITNFNASYDVAALQVNFNLSAASQVGFDFVFGSIEYPDYTNNYTDSFLAFLDGTAPANQIVFDAGGNAVQVGSSFASELTTADTNTAFSNPHGLMKLHTFTIQPLTAGDHTIIFEVGDVNDHILDSGVFISNLHAGSGSGGTGGDVPEPASLTLIAFGGAALAAARWYKRANIMSE